MIRIYVRQRMADKNLHQADVAKKTGIPVNTVNGLYHGHAKGIKWTQLDELCELFGCEVEDLYEV